MRKVLSYVAAASLLLGGIAVGCNKNRDNDDMNRGDRGGWKSSSDRSGMRSSDSGSGNMSGSSTGSGYGTGSSGTGSR